MAGNTRIAGLKRFLPDLPAPAIISAWEHYGGRWQFRFLGFGEVVHLLRAGGEQIEIFSDDKNKWEALGSMGGAPVECRPVDGHDKPVRWDAVYCAAKLSCPLIGE